MSSRRTPGPIRRDGNCCRRSPTPALLPMGRGVWVPRCAIAHLRSRFAWPGRRGYGFAISRRIASEVLKEPPALQSRGRREDRVLAAPAVSRADCGKQNAHEHTGSAETLRPSLRNGFTAYIVLSPVSRGSVATVASRILPRRLTPAYGRQDHTTSPYAPAPFVIGTSASTASHRTFVTIMIRPSCRVRQADRTTDLPFG